MNELLQIVQNYQGGESSSYTYFWNVVKDFFIPIASSIFAAIIAVWLFRGQIKNDKRKEKKRRKQIRADKLLYFSALVKGSIEAAKKQNEFLLEYMNEIDSDPINLKAFSKVVWQDLQRVSQKLDPEDYLIAYAGYYKGERSATIKEFKTILGSIDLFYEIFSELQNVVSRTITHTYNKKLEFQKYQQLIFAILNDFTLHLFITDKSKYNEFNSVMKPFQEKNKDEKIKFSFDYFYSDFFIPLYEFTSVYLATRPDNSSNAEEIQQYAKMGKEAYELLQDEAAEFKKIIKKDYDTVNEYMGKIQEKANRLLTDFS